MELKRIHQDFSVCQVEDYSLVNFESQYCFVGKTDEEKSFVCATSAVRDWTFENTPFCVLYSYIKKRKYCLIGNRKIHRDEKNR